MVEGATAMSTINVRNHQHIGGRATCPCGWVHTSTKKAAYIAACMHNENNHSGNYMVHADYAIQGE